MGKFKSGTARHRDPREQLTGPPKPGQGPGQGQGVASSLIMSTDVGPLASAPMPIPARGAHASVPAFQAEGGRKPQLGSRSSAAAIMSLWSNVETPLPRPDYPFPTSS
jgi:hypothetical protein